MEHQVIVPFPVRRVWSALLDADRLARCVPGYLPDADAADAAEPAGSVPSTAPAHRAGAPAELRGRLRLRIGGTSITYRGALRVSPERGGAGDVEEETLAVVGEATEARGDGSAKLTLQVRLAPAEDAGWATGVTVLGSVKARGRLAENGREALAAAGHRLLDRFVRALVEDLAEEESEAERARGDAGTGSGGGAGEGVPDGQMADELEGFADALDEEGPPFIEVPDSPAGLEAEFGFSPFDEGEDDEDASLEDADEVGGVDGVDGLDGVDGEGLGVPEDDDLDLPFPSEEFFRTGEADARGAEFGHDSSGAPGVGDSWGGPARRRTMVGRSAEEVDHAPPRGRYAPVPVPVPLAPRRDWRLVAGAAVAAGAAGVLVYKLIRARRP
ncbi:hypothetical protein BIV57_15570 [Mangrovactinospora gilvigrisea]|uniref:Carbon monoxide dehydrogenase n=1 Tax=Mangrovactinospora gilvigrisea TaxID=1428644 RepID=A0A1J7BDB9_9ACTN|nr:hypothetical protein [Mangrovactinospora gilvigrisea]OIV36573.1 hypothetical protein BIV57_15570 [Mangrovactinospora gilvigrisea]